MGDPRAAAAQGLGKPVAPTIAAHDQHAGILPVAGAELKPERLGIELRRIGGGFDDLRPRHTQTQQHAGGAGAG